VVAAAEAAASRHRTRDHVCSHVHARTGLQPAPRCKVLPAVAMGRGRSRVLSRARTGLQPAPRCKVLPAVAMGRGASHPPICGLDNCISLRDSPQIHLHHPSLRIVGTRLRSNNSARPARPTKSAWSTAAWRRQHVHGEQQGMGDGREDDLTTLPMLTEESITKHIKVWSSSVQSFATQTSLASM
jgi:hypothetical protein